MRITLWGGSNVFIKTNGIAKELNLPVVIHNRDAHKDTLDIIKMFQKQRG